MDSPNYSYFIAVYKDKPEDTWFNISFVNNCKADIGYLKVESTASCYDKALLLNEVKGLLSKEYVDIPQGEYLLMEKIDSSDITIDTYKYSFEIEVGQGLIKMCCKFCRNELLRSSDTGVLPVINEMGRMYLCA